MNYSEKILIGGQALRELGSSRHTDDVDYLIFDENNFNQFIFDQDNNVDYMNGNGSNFAEAIYKLEKGNSIASAQSLFELKAFAYLSHLRNFNQNKMNDCIYDMNFLAINFNITTVKTLSKFITKQEVLEIENTIK
jgi:hypothetical protein